MSIEDLSTLKIVDIMNEVEKLVNKDVNYIDALLEYAERKNIEIELLGELVRKSVVLKSKVRDNAETLNLVEKISRLPI